MEAQTIEAIPQTFSNPMLAAGFAESQTGCVHDVGRDNGRNTYPQRVKDDVTGF